MKKYKKDSTFSRLLAKYKYTYFFGFMAIILALSIVLGIVALATISRSYLTISKDIISDFIYNLNTNTDDEENTHIWPSDPRMVVSYYWEDNGDIYYRIYGVDSEIEPETYQAYKRDAGGSGEMNQYKEVEVNGYTNLAYYCRVNNNVKMNLTDSTVTIKYVKVYMNIEGEQNARREFITGYIVAAITMIILAFGAGILMTFEGTKPLKLFVTKQMDFVSDASHELRTPLAIVQSKIENVLTEPNKTVMDSSESLAIVLNEINRLTKLTNELLTLARNDKDNILLNMEVIDLNETLKEIIEPFKEIAAIQGRNLSYVGEKDIFIKADADKLKQIMIINIDNAIKYTSADDSITITLTANTYEASIEIKDTGIGITDETKKNIFERFYREDKARSRETGGNGLGLSIAYTLVNLQKGRITVDHNYPKGTKFNIYFQRIKKKQNDMIL